MTALHSLKKIAGLLCAIALCFGAMSVLDTEDAHADVLIGADFNGAFQLGEVSSDSLGLGANLRLGWQEDAIPVLRIATEFQLNYMGFAIENVDTSSVTGTADNATLRLLSPRARARVGFDFLVGLALYGHVGYGFVNQTGSFGDDSGLSYDVGIAFDVTSIPFVNLGIHSGYNAFFSGANPDVDPINWLDFGLHVEVVF